MSDRNVEAKIIAEYNPVAAGKPLKVAIQLTHEDHYHMYGKVVGEGSAGLPTQVTWNLPEEWRIEELPWPATKELASTGGETIQGYEGTVYLPYQLIPPPGLSPGGSIRLEAMVQGLVCSESTCMPTTLNAFLNLSVGAESEATADSKNIFGNLTESTVSGTNGEVPAPGKGHLAVMLVFAFLGGLILNVMPCVFPVLGIKITGIASQSGEDRRRIFHHGLAYTFGVLVSFWGIVALLQTFHISWGGQFQSPLFVYGIVLLFTVFGLNMAGLFEVGTSAVGVGSNLMHQPKLKGSFFSGLLATLVSTPCSAPFLAPALVYGLSLSLLSSLLFFSVIGFGLAFPFLLLSVSPGLLRRFPRPGPWMESFKQGMSFLMLGAALFFAWTLMGQVSEIGQRDLLLGLPVIAMGLWVYGRWCPIFQRTATRLKGAAAAAMLVAFGVWWSWPQPKDILWEKWAPEIVRALHEEGTPVYVDFTARWCATCQVNKRVYKDDDLRREFQKKGITLLKADWTDHDERITKALKELDKVAIPVNALYIPGREKPIILPELLTVDKVKAALSELEKQ